MYEAVGFGGKGPMMIGVLWFENFLSLAIIGLRMYTRKFIRGKVGWDDYCLLITWVLMAIFTTTTTVACFHGMGRHYHELETDQFSMAMMLVMCGQFIVALAIGMGKVVVAIFLLRIVTAHWQRWFLWFCIVTMMFLSVFLSVAVFAQCTPVESIWNPLLIEQKTCHLDLSIVAFVVCSYAAAMDLVLALFPWIALRNLNMKRKERITICLSLSLGIFAGVCGIVRTSGLSALSNSEDYLFAISDSIVWTASEVTTTIVCVCIPALRPLYSKLHGNESNSGGYRKYNGSSAEKNGAYELSSYPGNKRAEGFACNEDGLKTDIKASHVHAAKINDSDETILLQGDSNILRVQEVTVTYEEASTKADSKK